MTGILSKHRHLYSLLLLLVLLYALSLLLSLKNAFDIVEISDSNSKPLRSSIEASDEQRRQDPIAIYIPKFNSNQWVTAEEEWIHSSMSDLSDCVKFLLRPRTVNEINEALDKAKSSVMKPFGKDFLEKYDVERDSKEKDLNRNFAFVVTPKDYMSTTEEHMRTLSNMFPSIAMVYVVPAALFPERELATLLDEARKYENVLLADWPCSPFDRHHAFKSYASYFIPPAVKYLLHINNDVFFVDESRETRNKKILDAIEALEGSQSHAMHIITGEYSKKNRENDPASDTMHNMVIEYPEYVPVNVNGIIIDFLVYKYSKEEDRATSKGHHDIGKSPYLEDHALLVCTNISRHLFDPSVSDDKEMYSLGFMSAFLGSTSQNLKSAYPLQYPHLSDTIIYYIYHAGSYQSNKKWDWAYSQLRRLDARNTVESITNLKEKLGFYIPPNRYSYLFGEKIMLGAQIHFAEEDLQLPLDYLQKLKVSYTLNALASFGFTHFLIGGSYPTASSTYLDLFNISTQLYQKDKQASDFQTIISAKTVREPSAYLFQNVGPKVSIDTTKANRNVWIDTIINNAKKSKYGNLSSNMLADLIKKGFYSYSPLFVDPLKKGAPSIIWFVVKRTKETEELRKWMSHNAASLVFSSEDDQYDDIVVHLRWLTEFNYKSETGQDIKSLQSKSCLYPSTVALNNTYGSFSHNTHRYLFPVNGFRAVSNVVNGLSNKDLVHIIDNPFGDWVHNDKREKRTIRFSSLKVFQYAPCTHWILGELEKHLNNVLMSDGENST